MSNYWKDEFDAERLAGAFAALSNPHRLRLFLRLVECCGGAVNCAEEAAGACVGDLAADMELAPSTVSHHLKELRYAGLIDKNRDGKEVMCCVSPGALAEIRKFIEAALGTPASTASCDCS